jgi:hypothetical protein
VRCLERSGHFYEAAPVKSPRCASATLLSSLRTAFTLSAGCKLAASSFVGAREPSD